MIFLPDATIVLKNRPTRYNLALGGAMHVDETCERCGESFAEHSTYHEVLTEEAKVVAEQHRSSWGIGLYCPTLQDDEQFRTRSEG